MHRMTVKCAYSCNSNLCFMKIIYALRTPGAFKSISFFVTLFFMSQLFAQNCALPNNFGQCSGGQGQILVGGANISNGQNFWSSSSNLTVTGTVKVNNGGQLTVCSGNLTLNGLDMAGGTIVVLSGATLNVQNATTLTGSSEIFNYGTVNFNNNVTLQANDSRIYNHISGIINVSSPHQMLINNNAQLINAGVVNVYTINLNVNNPNPNAVCLLPNAVLIATNLIDQTNNNNGINGQTNSCVFVLNNYTLNNTSSTSSLLVCLSPTASGTGSFGQASPTTNCASCGILQSNLITFNTTSNPNSLCVGQSATLSAGVSFVPFGMQFQWGTGTVGSNIISGATSSSIIVSPNQSTTYWVRLVEIANPNNVSTTNGSVSIAVNAPTVNVSLSNNDMVWNGRISNNWANTSNWIVFNNGQFTQAQSIPTAAQNVIIPTSNQTCVNNNANIPSGTRSANNLTIETNATLTMTGGVLRVSGDFTNNGTFTPGTNTVEMRGGVNQNLIMNSNSKTFYNLTVEKTAGEVLLGSNIDVQNEINMISKNLRLNSNYIDLGTAGNIVNESNNSQIYCFCPSAYVQRTATISSSTTVQPGNLGITFTTNGNQMGQTVIRRRHVEAGSNGVSGLGVLQLSGVSRIYDVSPEFNGDAYAGNLNVDINCVFSSLDAQNVSQLNNLSIYRSQNQGSSWSNIGFTSSGTNSLFLQGLTGFSWLTFGPDDQSNVPLPIELLSFNATPVNDAVQLTWSTASEKDNDFFTVERSIDGENWENVLFVEGAGTSIHRIDYASADLRPYKGLSYYRLKQTDFDGQFTHSSAVAVYVNSEDKEFLFATNVMGQKVDLNAKGLVILVFSNGEFLKVVNE